MAITGLLSHADRSRQVAPRDLPPLIEILSGSLRETTSVVRAKIEISGTAILARACPYIKKETALVSTSALFNSSFGPAVLVRAKSRTAEYQPAQSPKTSHALTMSLSNPAAFLKAMLPRVPLVVKTVLLHGIGLSPVAGKQDLRTELTVVIIRSFMGFKAPIGKQQKGSMRDPGIRGPLWVSKVTLPQPEDAVQDAVLKAFEELKLDGAGQTCDIPGVGPVEAEWTGYRSGASKTASLPDISEEEKYRELRKEASSNSVVLYFHGGAYM